MTPDKTTMDSIMKKFDKKFNKPMNEETFHLYANRTGVYLDYTDIKSFFRTEITELVKGLIPEEKKDEDSYGMYETGYNKCCKDIKDRAKAAGINLE